MSFVLSSDMEDATHWTVNGDSLFRVTAAALSIDVLFLTLFCSEELQLC
jgi:hypothetical protein